MHIPRDISHRKQFFVRLASAVFVSNSFGTVALVTKYRDSALEVRALFAPATWLSTQNQLT